MVGHQIRLHGDDNFSYWLEKKQKEKKRNLLVAYVGVYMMKSRLRMMP